MTSEKKQIYTRRISEANRTQLIVIVYEMAIDYIGDAEDALTRRDTDAFAIALKRAGACVDELMRCLDYQYEISGYLRQLYLFVKMEMIRASGRLDAVHLQNCARTLSRLRDAFDRIAETDDSEAEMGNIETVYAGLTYGRGTLNESVSLDVNRGLKA